MPKLPCQQLSHERLVLAATLAVVTLLGACAASDQDIDPSVDGYEDIELAQEFSLGGWTAYTTDGAIPVECPPNMAMTGFGARGKYADDIRINCLPVKGFNKELGHTWWTGHFSEEGQGGMACGEGAFITGIACSGKYCDNVSLRCTDFHGRRNASDEPPRCKHWGWYSEEQGESNNFGEQWFATTAFCQGKYCYDMQFETCNNYSF